LLAKLPVIIVAAIIIEALGRCLVAIKVENIMIFAISGDRGEFDTVKVNVELRAYPLVNPQRRAGIASERLPQDDFPIVGSGNDVVSVKEIREICVGAERPRGREATYRSVFGIVGRNEQADIVGRLEQQLATKAIIFFAIIGFV